MKQLWSRISGIGVGQDQASVDARTVVFTNRLGLILGLFAFSSVFINILLHTYTFVPVLLAATFMMSINFLFNYKGFYLLAKSNLMLSALGVLSYMLMHGGAGSGLEFYFISLTFLPAIIFRQKRRMILFQALCVGCLIFQRLYYNTHFLPPKDGPVVFTVFFIVNSIYSSLLVVLGIMFFKNASHQQEIILLSRNKTIENQNKELQQINLELSRTNNDLEQFAYVASHDLKEPLRMIASYSQLLTQRFDADEESREFSGFILQGVSRMQQLINDLLMYSKITHAEEKFSWVDLEKLLDQLCFLLKPEVQKVNGSIHYMHLPMVYGNESQLIQVFQNMITNALKFIPAGQAALINIEVEAKPEEWLVSVKDNGIGISPQYHKKIFVIFQRLHQQEEYPGTGIGLAIVKKIVEQHGGKIWVESTPGGGATFYFSIKKPKAKAQRAKGNKQIAV